MRKSCAGSCADILWVLYDRSCAGSCAKVRLRAYSARPPRASKMLSKVEFLEWARQGLVESLVQRLVRVLYGLRSGLFEKFSRRCL